MIQSPHVFAEDHVPRELPHRHDEMVTLTRAWKPAIHGHPADDVIITGPSGVGKTALARNGLSYLQAEAHTPSVHVRCLGTTAGDILREALEPLGERPSPTAPLDDLHWTLRDVVDEPVVVILDEADTLVNNEALTRLCGVKQLSLVAITHDPDRWLAHAEPQARERLEGERTEQISLDRYKTNELVDILQQRAEQGLRPDSVRCEQLRGIANKVAGVARDGIQSLRAAAELAEERGHAQITAEDLADCYERAQYRIREANLTSLPFHHQVIYAIVQDAGEISASDLHDRYDAIADDVYREINWTPIGKRGRRNKLRKLQEYDLIQWDGQNKHRVYKPLDDTVESKIDVSLL